MKLLFFSDLHGVATAFELLLKQAETLSPDRLVFLGDALYHGPRNGVPPFYDSRRTAEIFNAHRNCILAVRGNCDSEVDQMMIDLPIMADYAMAYSDGTEFFLTHGHIWNESRLPNIGPGTVLVHGHTHVPTLHAGPGGTTVFNPGSVALPKCGIPPTFGFFDGKSLIHYDLATMERLEIG